MCSATDELKKLLDERGVKWRYDSGIVDFEKDGRWYSAWAYSDNAMCVSTGYLTPAQVVEATLGRGECTYEHVANVVENGLSLNCSGDVCSACGRAQIGMQIPNYCPNCGREVVSA